MVIVDSGKRYAYVANTDSGTVVKIDLKGFNVVNEVKIGKEAEGLMLTNEEDLLLVTDRKDNYVAVIRTKDMIFINKIETNKGPVRIERFNNGKSAVVTNTVSGNAQTIDLTSFAINKAFNTTASSLFPVPINVYVREDQTTAYITNSFAGNISIVDLVQGQVLRTFQAGYMPDGVAYSKVTAVNHDEPTGALFTSFPLDIDANIDTVWRIVKNVEDYHRISHGAITAHLSEDLKPGKTITLELYKDKFVGKFIPKSVETISVVDDDMKVLAWVRKLPDGKYTERYHFLQPTPDNKIRSEIVLRIPGPIGDATSLTLGQLITEALDELNEGIKAEAELTKRG